MNLIKLFGLALILMFNYSFGQELSLITPKKNSIIIEDTIPFFWNQPNGDTAQLEIATDINFSTIIIDSTDTNGIVRLASSLFLANSSYYWRVIHKGNTSPVRKIIFFKPSDIPSALMWLDADSNITHTTNDVSVWGNIINSNHAIQTTPSSRPKWVANEPIINNLGAVRFDGGDDYMEFAPINNIRTAIMVAKHTGSTTVIYAPIIIGHSTTYDFHAGDGVGKLFGSFTNDFVRLGSGRVNNLSIPPISIDIPTEYNLISLTTTGDVEAERITKDRIFNTRNWKGDYVQILFFSDVLSDSLIWLTEQYIDQKYFPGISLGADILNFNYCDSAILSGEKHFASYLWSTGETSDSIVVKSPGAYWVQTTDLFGFQSTDTINVIYPSIFASNVIDTTICYGDTLILSSKLDTVNFDFLWSNGSTDSIIKVVDPNKYWVTVTDTFGCSIVSDTIAVSIDSLANQLSLGTDKAVCKGFVLGIANGNRPDLSYLWHTGDVTPQITIDTTGEYMLEAISSNNCIARDTIQITVNGIAPTVGFESSNLCTNAITIFSDTSFTTDGSNIVDWHWDFGDGSTSILQNPQYLYADSGSFNVTLEILTDSGCTNSLIQSIQIHIPPVAGFFSNTTPLCSNTPINFVDNSFSADGAIEEWYWDFGDVVVSDTSTARNASYVYSSVNNYGVQLVTTSIYGCKDTILSPFLIKAAPTALFTSTNNCLNSATQFTDVSVGNVLSVSWDFGDLNTSILNNPTNSYGMSGVYNVTMIATELNGCVDTLIEPLTIYENPIAKYNAVDFCIENTKQFFDSSTTSSGTIVNWGWNIVGSSNQSSDQNPIFSFSPSDTGQYFVNLTVMNDVGCSDSIQDTLNIFPLPIPQFTYTPKVGEPPLLVDFTNETMGAIDYFWNFGDDSTSTIFSPSHTYTDTSIYSVNMIAIGANGCSDSISENVFVVIPITDIAVDNVICEIIPNTNFFRILAQIRNLGNFEISNMILQTRPSNSETIIESWNGSLKVGDSYSYQFSEFFKLENNEIPEVVCVQALNPNDRLDDFPNNNEFCIFGNEFKLIDISPVPAADVINLTYVIPSSGNVRINLYASDGGMIAELFSGDIGKGLIRQSFNLSSYSNGLYFIHIEHLGRNIKEKIVIK